MTWHNEHPEYGRQYHIDHKERRDEIKKNWRAKNLKRERAHDRIRYLNRKEESTELSEGEMEQMVELARKYPKHKIVG